MCLFVQEARLDLTGLYDVTFIRSSCFAFFISYIFFVIFACFHCMTFFSQLYAFLDLYMASTYQGLQMRINLYGRFTC